MWSSKMKLPEILPLLVGLSGALFVLGCRPQYPACRKDSDCRDREFCVQNRCQQCRTDADCSTGLSCAEGACRHDKAYCDTSADCSEGQICREHKCSPCLSSTECPEGTVCLNQSCVSAECHTTEDCPAGLSCIDSTCKVDAPAAANGDECHLEPVYFDFDSANLEGRMRRVLEENYECLKERKGRLTLEGHCDPRGTTEYNMGLGERRARIVRKLLKSMGIDPSQLRVVSKGEEEATGKGESGWSKDRRVDFE